MVLKIRLRDNVTEQLRSQGLSSKARKDVGARKVIVFLQLVLDWAQQSQGKVNVIKYFYFGRVMVDRGQTIEDVIFFYFGGNHS